MSRTRSGSASGGTSRRLSSSAAWPSANCPVAASALARASNSSTRDLRPEPNRGGAAARGRTRRPRSRVPAARLSRRPRVRPRQQRVALPPGPRNVVGAFCRRGAECLERGGAPFMRAQAPARGRRLIDGPSDERVPEAKPAGYVGLANEVEPEEGVQRLERLPARGRLRRPPQARARRGHPPRRLPEARGVLHRRGARTPRPMHQRRQPARRDRPTKSGRRRADPATRRSERASCSR